MNETRHKDGFDLEALAKLHMFHRKMPSSLYTMDSSFPLQGWSFRAVHSVICKSETGSCLMVNVVLHMAYMVVTVRLTPKGKYFSYAALNCCSAVDSVCEVEHRHRGRWFGSFGRDGQILLGRAKGRWYFFF